MLFHLGGGAAPHPAAAAIWFATRSTGTCDPVPDEPPFSADGICGVNSFIGATCAGSAFGDCCSWAGECGSGNAYCSPENCDPVYGTCGGGGGSGPPVSTAIPTVL
ncbi:hypothetical protein SODALDRAFT_332057 [Sodiomyces alkalinus F11]|uniref:Chitin-binding type-1 domain-containing protein n=1 Tax=Sodiomyces alkalinus (strain CBS 110278 / VKM F-3762 / F11) TaxID=1314773 RepID=A0A3N2PZI9_SODAK|nr:hypothetical protein SODALDRAFT_332057 [Sodiomyces alkalinus F11]ROT39913.1 hypothetical protein SODALDRAFT_332057 [Sodiomyces alkalinus F11]